MEFGERVRYLREIKGLNQTQLGKKTGMTQRKISYMECGKYEPSMGDLLALCVFFNVSADFLLGLPDGMPYPKR